MRAAKRELRVVEIATHEVVETVDYRRTLGDNKIPGWDPTFTWEAQAAGRKADPKYDGDLARLIWLEWWVKWALDNCTWPAIHNH